MRTPALPARGLVTADARHASGKEAILIRVHALDGEILSLCLETQAAMSHRSRELNQA